MGLTEFEHLTYRRRHWFVAQMKIQKKFEEDENDAAAEQAAKSGSN